MTDHLIIDRLCIENESMEYQVEALTEALNTLLESVKLCRDCNVHLDSLNDAVDKAEKVLEGKQ